MIRPIQLWRFVQILGTLVRFGLSRELAGRAKRGWLRWLSYLNPIAIRSKKRSRGELLCHMLERLGPIFVKFGQQLSVRPDLFPADVILALSKLQDQVTPFADDLAMFEIERALGQPIADVFAQIDKTPLAAASIAQVYAGKLCSGEDVIIKVLRPNIERTIRQDLALMYAGARWVERHCNFGQRLKPVEMVAEFEYTILGELDLVREAANASQLRRNFAGSKQMYVPKIYWRYTHPSIMVMERIYGIRISEVKQLKAANVNLKLLAENGVDIFFTQVLRDSFFHADMHPGNLFVDITQPDRPRYLGVDFGIMGALSENDQYYLAKNLLAFFNRDYRSVAKLHVACGWVPPDTRVDQFESAIRAVCEPIFQRPLKEISFGQVLLGLIKTAEQFHMEMQPQLMLLQKTLVNIEGLGRQLYPDLDLWNTAKPIIEKWLRARYNLCDMAKKSKQELPELLEKFLASPALVHQLLENTVQIQHQQRYAPPPKLNINTQRNVSLFTGVGIGLLLSVGIALYLQIPTSPVLWYTGGIGALGVIVGSLRERNGSSK